MPIQAKRKQQNETQKTQGADDARDSMKDQTAETDRRRERAKMLRLKNRSTSFRKAG